MWNRRFTLQDYGGVRHCDMVAVTRSGYELLTDFQSDIESLTVSNPSSHSRRSRAISIPFWTRQRSSKRFDNGWRRDSWQKR